MTSSERGGPELRGRTRAAAWLRSRLFWTVIGVPNLLSLLYFGLIASPVYVSNASMLVFRPAQSSVNVASMLSGGGAESFEGGHILQAYIQSWTEYQRLSGRFDLAGHYGAGDFVSRYGGLGSLLRRNDVALWKFYRRQAVVEMNEKNNIVTLQMKAYTPEYAASLARAVLEDAIAHIDAMNQQMDRDYAANAARSRQAVQERLERAEADLAEYRGRIGVLDPDAHYTAQLGLLNSLLQTRARLETQYQALTAATPKNPVAENLSRGLAATNAQIERMQADVRTLAGQNARYHALLMARDNDAALLKEIDTAAQQADLNSIRSKYYLQVISPVSTPGSPELPRRLEWIFGVFAGSLLLWTLVR